MVNRGAHMSFHILKRFLCALVLCFCPNILFGQDLDVGNPSLFDPEKDTSFSLRISAFPSLMIFSLSAESHGARTYRQLTAAYFRSLKKRIAARPDLLKKQLTMKLSVKFNY